MNLSKITDALNDERRSIAYANYLRERFLEDYKNRPAGQELGNGVEFDFIKVDGTKRHALGTYKPWVSTSGVHKTPNPMQFSYWDLEKDAYRSFIITQLVIPSDFEVKEYEGVVETPSEDTAVAAMDFIRNWKTLAPRPYGQLVPQFEYLELSTDGSDLKISGTSEKVVNEAVNFVLDGFEGTTLKTSVREGL